MELKTAKAAKQSHLATLLFQAKDDETKAMKSQLSACVANAESQVQIAIDKKIEEINKDKEKYVTGKQLITCVNS